MVRPFLLILALAFAFAPVATVMQAQQETASGSGGGSLARAKEIYTRDCLVCHGENGDGKTGIATDRELALPDWTDGKYLAGRPDQLLFQSIRHGRGKMPAESVGRADDAEVRDLIRYVRTMAKEEARVVGTERK